MTGFTLEAEEDNEFCDSADDSWLWSPPLPLEQDAESEQEDSSLVGVNSAFSGGIRRCRMVLMPLLLLWEYVAMVEHREEFFTRKNENYCVIFRFSMVSESLLEIKDVLKKEGSIEFQSIKVAHSNSIQS